MSIISKALKLLRSPSSLRLPIPQLRPLLRYSTATTTEPPSPQQKLPHQKTKYYGKIDVYIAGIQFYEGIASEGEALVVQRQPNNPYDCNAFRVDNADGTQVGYIPAFVAKDIAPLVDAGLITIEMEPTASRCYMQPASIEVFGAAKTEKRLRELSERGKEIWGLRLKDGVAVISAMELLKTAAIGLSWERRLREEAVLDRKNTNPLTPPSKDNQKPRSRSRYYDYMVSSKVKKAPKSTPKTALKSAKIITRTKSMVLYGKIAARIVWYMRYPLVGTHHAEPIILQREPGKQKHPHAIRADNARGEQMGYIPFSLSKKLAPYVDEGLVAIEGVSWKHGIEYPRDFIPLTINLYGPAPKRKDIRAQLTEKGLLGSPCIWRFYADRAVGTAHRTGISQEI